MILRRNFVLLLLSLVPILLLASAPLFPRGSDPRGFGPQFLVGLYAWAASAGLSLVCIAVLAVSRRLHFSAPLVITATFIAAAPFIYLLIGVLLGHA